MGYKASRCIEGVIDVGDNVVGMLDAYRKAHISLADTGLQLVFWRQLRMRGGCRVDRERADVTDVGDVINELQAVDELAASVLTTAELETDQGAVAALKIGVGPAFLFTGHQAGENHLR